MTCSVQRGERYTMLTLSFARPPNKDDIARIRTEVQPWDIGENFASQFETIPWARRPTQMGIQWETARLEADASMLEQVRYAMRLFMGMGEPEETTIDRTAGRALRGPTEPVPLANHA